VTPIVDTLIGNETSCVRLVHRLTGLFILARRLTGSRTLVRGRGKRRRGRVAAAILAINDMECLAGPDHSPLMFAALMIGHHFSISAL
jgi:hypothetical protein